MKRQKFNRIIIEIAVVTVLTVMAAFLSFFNLGSNAVPSNAYVAKSGNYAQFEVIDNVPDTLAYYTGIQSQSGLISVNGRIGQHTKRLGSTAVQNGDMYAWNRLDLTGAYNFVKINFEGSGLLSAITLVDYLGNVVPATDYEVVECSAGLAGYLENQPSTYSEGDCVLIQTTRRQQIEGSNATEIAAYALSRVDVACNGLGNVVISLTDDRQSLDYVVCEVNVNDGITSADTRIKYTSYEVRFSNGLNVLELAFLTNNRHIQLNLTDTGATGEHAVYDEQNLFPSRTDFTSGMYFDEIYFARTAYEFLTGANSVYEWTHPHLGKVILAIGIDLFGMNPFGWRCMSALFSTLIIPLSYLIGRVLFKRIKYAALFAFLMIIEGIRLVQGRIGTVDSFLVFFILASYLNMFLFYKNCRADCRAFKWLIPLAFAGLFFGSAASVKWSGVYAGIGLFVIFVMAICRRITQFHRCKKRDEFRGVKVAKKKVTFAVISCVLTAFMFFVVGTAFIYVASYVPHAECEGIADVDVTRSVCEILTLKLPDGEYQSLGEALYEANAGKSEFTRMILRIQGDIFDYHSDLQATHPYSSTWMTWPFGYLPVFFAYDDAAWDGAYARIYSAGVPTVWIAGLVGTLYCVATLIRSRRKCALSGEQRNRNFVAGFLLVGALANYVPWIFITRCTFIYHYYPTVPFVLAMGVLALMNVEAQSADEPTPLLTGRRLVLSKGGAKLRYISQTAAGAGYSGTTRAACILKVFLIMAVATFVLMFPAMTGVPVPRAIAKVLYGWTGSV